MNHVKNALAIAGLLATVAVASAHEGPDPVAHWTFTPRHVSDGVCHARLGPDLRLPSHARLTTDSTGSALDLAGASDESAVTDLLIGDDRHLLPNTAFTLSVWASIDEAESHGTLLATADARTDRVAGWRLGYDETRFTFEATSGGKTHRLLGKTGYQKGKWHHVVAIYDGQQIQLFVDDDREASTTIGATPIDYPAEAVVGVGGTGVVGQTSLRGRLREASIYDMAARPSWVTHAYEHLRHIVTTQPTPRSSNLAMLVEPYLQNATTQGMTVMWQTTSKGTSVVHYGETSECELSAEGDDAEIHEVRLTGLEPATQYFYRVETIDANGRSATSRVSTFSTAVEPGTPFAFAIISDTQFNPEVAVRLSRHAWAQRPSFLLHPGDLVDTGVNDSHWTQHFFPGMKPLISRVPLFPVLGNHEQNAQNYFDYMSLPEPEYYYEFRYGDAHFFMLDSNRNIGPGSEQYAWLDDALAASDAKWKFACHHHPPYSSDENDYGDLSKTNKSERGDLRARQLSRLYEEHAVDIVWTGHIHSYERTWPVREGRAVGDGDGPIYMIVGGGGGSLETPGPYRPFFQNQVRRGHHYVMAHLNGNALELRSYDLDDQLFDTLRLVKPSE